MGYCCQMTGSKIFVSTENTGRVLAKMKDFPYRFELDQDGSIIGVCFIGHKLSDEYEAFQQAAPYILSGSYIEMRGDDGERWKWEFQNGVCKVVRTRQYWSQ